MLIYKPASHCNKPSPTIVASYCCKRMGYGNMYYLFYSSRPGCSFSEWKYLKYRTSKPVYDWCTVNETHVSRQTAEKISPLNTIETVKVWSMSNHDKHANSPAAISRALLQKLLCEFLFVRWPKPLTMEENVGQSTAEIEVICLESGLQDVTRYVSDQVVYNLKWSTVVRACCFWFEYCCS